MSCVLKRSDSSVTSRGRWNVSKDEPVLWIKLEEKLYAGDGFASKVAFLYLTSSPMPYSSVKLLVLRKRTTI